MFRATFQIYARVEHIVPLIEAGYIEAADLRVRLLLAFLFFPVSVPILLPGIQATSKFLAGEAFLTTIPELRLLFAFMPAVVAASMLLFQEIFME